MLPLGNATARRRLVAPCIAEAAASFKGAAAEIPDSKRGDTININASGQSLFSAADFGTGHPPRPRRSGARQIWPGGAPSPQEIGSLASRFPVGCGTFHETQSGAGYREI